MAAVIVFCATARHYTHLDICLKWTRSDFMEGNYWAFVSWAGTLVAISEVLGGSLALQLFVLGEVR